MLYFPMVSTLSFLVSICRRWSFEFFAPVFNIADAAISTGVITLLVFQKKFYKKEKVSVTEVVKDEMEKAAK